MDREHVKQRIKYLVEHGGVHEKPHDWAKLGAILAAASCVLTVVGLIFVV